MACGAVPRISNGRADRILLLSALLELNDAGQKHRVIFDAADKTTAPLATQLVTDKQVLFDAVKSGKSARQIQKLAGQQGPLNSQRLTLRAETFAKMWALLTSQQKADVDDSMCEDIGEFLANARPPSANESPAGPPRSIVRVGGNGIVGGFPEISRSRNGVGAVTMWRTIS